MEHIDIICFHNGDIFPGPQQRRLTYRSKKKTKDRKKDKEKERKERNSVGKKKVEIPSIYSHVSISDPIVKNCNNQVITVTTQSAPDQCWFQHPPPPPPPPTTPDTVERHFR